MPENPTPRQMVKDLLQGISPPRPWFVPIVFSLGARLESLPLREFLKNPTKISNAMRQIRGHLRSDGITCYFDRWLEVDALGGIPQGDTSGALATVHWPHAGRGDDLPHGMRSPEEAVNSAPVRVAVEVMRRLNALVRDGTLLMAGVTGPFTLATRMIPASGNGSGSQVFSEAAMELAASVTMKIASAFVEAGANLIFIREEILPALSRESGEMWASVLSPTFNVIKFYGALPVLQLSEQAFSANLEVMLRQHWDAALCPTASALTPLPMAQIQELHAIGLGIAWPVETVATTSLGGGDSTGWLAQAVAELRPVLVTTDDDVPAATDMKRLLKIAEEVRR